MSAGSKVSDTKQEYQYAIPYVTPSGHEFTFYDTPENERLVVKHASGSHIEFKADGSVFIKAVKDVHTHSSVLSAQAETTKGADATTNRVDTDYTWDVGGRLRIKCAELDFEIGSTGRIIAGTDLIVSANNTISKSTESLSLEGQKSIYVDTKELRERVVARQSEIGTTAEDGLGGVNIMHVHGNTIIQNDDEAGGITIASKGYLNLVAGKERVDLIGNWNRKPSEEAISTFTTKVFESDGELDVSTKPGDVYFESAAGAYYNYAKSVGGSTTSGSDGFKVEVSTGNETQAVKSGDRTRTVSGDEQVDITGDYTRNANMIYLN